MASSNPNLEELRQRLADLRQGDVSPSPAVPWADAPIGGLAAGETATDLRSTAAALRQRSAQVTGIPTPEATSDLPSASPQAVVPASLPPEVELHLQRLQGQANRINDLAHQQETAVHEFKRSMDSLGWSLQRHGLTQYWTLEQFCQVQSVAVAQVVQDPQGGLRLTQAPIDLYQQERDASQTAQWLRHQQVAPGRADWGAGWQALWAEPLAGLDRIWQALTTTLESRSRLTPLSLVGWVLGGAIARQALDLLLAANPNLWPLLVGAMVGAVLFALYRLMTRPTIDLAVIVPLLLALLGLMVGGYL